VAEWTDDVLTILSLASRGVMVLLEHADDAHLRELFLAVREAHPTADVVLTPEALFDAALGSVGVYIPLAEHADALNAGRPLVAERELRVLLWCDAKTTSALATKAPDFYDWISHVVECPDKPAPWVATFPLTRATTRDASALQAQAEFLLAHGSTSEALAVAERARAIFAERYDPTHPSVGSMLMLAGEALLRLGRHHEGRQHLEKAVEVLSERLGRAHHTTLQARLLLALELRRANTLDAMEPIEPMLAQLTARLGSHHPWVRRLSDLAEDSGPIENPSTEVRN